MKKRKLVSMTLWLFIITFAIPISAHSAVIFSDDFESYTSGVYPSPPWYNIFSGRSGYVTTEQARSGTQSFRSESYSNWARWDYVPLSTVPDRFVYQAAVYLTAPGRGGTVGFGYRRPTVPNEGRFGNSVFFAPDSKVYFWTVTTPPTLLLDSWTAGVWYDVRVRIDYLNNVADVYLNGVLVGDDLPTDPKVISDSGVPVLLNQFGMFGANFPGGGTSVIYYDDMAITTGQAFDIKPGSCPNPVNTKSGGVLPAAIVGGADFDVSQIDPATVRLEGVVALRWDYEDVATPYELLSQEPDAYACSEAGPDGYMDLTLKFDSKALVGALGPVSDREVRILQFTGNLLDGTPITGEDVVIILNKK